jgi:DNA recombination protein RmuC
MTVMSSVLILVGVLAGLAAGLLIGRYVSGRESAAALAQTQTDSTAREAQALQAASDTATHLARAEGELAEARAERDALRLQQAEAHTIDERLKPLKETVDSLRTQAVQANQERAKADEAIRVQIEHVQRGYATLEGATRQLVSAMSSASSRGQWGEMQLETLLSHSGLLEGIHYRRQDTRGGDEGVSRPDIVIALPGGAEVLVDAKFPFDSYWKGIEAADSPEAATHFRKHAEDVLARAKALSSKRYSDSSRSPDFVVMFLPLESLLQAALEANGLLLEETFQRNVILATPTSMLAMLRTIAFGYQRNDLAENAERIQELGAEMLQRLGKLVEHLDKMGRGLKSAVTGYNDFVGSFERQAMVTARRMNELGVASGRELTAPAELHETIRTPTLTGMGELEA